MSSIADFKTKLALDFSRKLNKHIRPKDIALGSVSSPEINTPRNCQVIATIDGVDHRIIYDRYDFQLLMRNLPSNIKITTQQRVENARGLVPFINKRFGMDLSPEDIEDRPIDPESMTVSIFASPTSYRFQGVFSLPISQPSITLFPKPDNWFKADNDGSNAGLQDKAITYPLKYVTGPDGRKWATSNNGGSALLGNGIELPAGGEFVLDFKVFFKSFPTYVSFLTSSHGASGAPGSMYWYGSKFYQYGNGPLQNTPMDVNKAYRYTLRGKGGTTYLYLDGKLVGQWASAGAGMTLKSFGDQDSYTSHFPTDVIHFRDLKSYGRALTDAEFMTLFESELDEYVLTPPMNEFLFNGSGLNTGTNKTTMTAPMTYESVRKGNTAHLSGTAAVMFGNDARIKVCGDYTVDFQVVLKNLPEYLCFMSVGVGTKYANGSFYLAGGRFYEYGVTPSGSELSQIPAAGIGVPYRVTVVSKDGTSSLYINKKFIRTYPSPAAALNRYLVAFRDAPSHVTQWSSAYDIDFIRSWEVGLTDMDLKKLFREPTSPRKAKFSYPLQGNRESIGEEFIPFPTVPTRYITVGDEKMAVVPAGPLPGFSLDINKDFTFSVDVVVSTDRYLTFFANPATSAGRGALMFYYGAPYLALWGDSSGTTLPSPSIADGLRHNIKVRCRNGVVELFVDDIVYDKFTNPKNGQPWSGIGDANTVSAGWTDACAMSNLQVWDYGLTDAELIGVTGEPLPLPLHHWPLSGDSTNLGRGGTPWAGALTWVEFQGKTWGTVPVGNYYSDIGANLSFSTDFTLDVTLVANDVGDEYAQLFRNNAGSSDVLGDIFTWRNMAVGHMNKPCFQSLGYSGFADCKTVPFVNDAANRLTIRRIGNNWTVYQDGILRWTFTSTASGFWRWFGSSRKRSKQYVRGVRYWESGLDDTTLATLFRM